MIQSIFTTLGDAGTAFIAFLKNLIGSGSEILWTTTEAGVTTIQPVGILLLCGVGVGAVYGIIRLLMKLVKGSTRA